MSEAVARLARWQISGFEGFENWLSDVRPHIPNARGGTVAFTWVNDWLRDEVRRALDPKHHTICISLPRRHGKSVISALVIVWRFHTKRGQTIAIVSNSEQQSTDTLFRLARGIVEHTPELRKLVSSGAIKVTDSHIEYKAAGSTITGYPANPAALFGKQLSVAAVSELHAARSDAVYQAVASATVDTADGLVLVDSTVGPRSSPLFALFGLAQSGGDPTLAYVHLEYSDLEDAIARGPPWIKPERLRSRARQQLPLDFAVQHLNQWSSGSNSLFTAEIIERCKAKYPLDPKAIADGRPYMVAGALDRAYGFSLNGDATVCACTLKTLAGKEPEFYVLAADKVAFSSLGGIKRAFSRFVREFGMKRVAIEAYNAQDIAAWCAEQREFDHEVVHPTSERQSNIFTELYNAANDGRLHIAPQFTKLFDELATIEYRLEAGDRGTRPKFGSPKGSHDDHCYALAWSLFALRAYEPQPYALAGVSCDAPGVVARLYVLNDGALVPPCADTCRSMGAVRDLYARYRTRAGVAPLAIEDFVSAKIRNAGSHTVRR